MIAIRAYNPIALKRFVANAGLTESQVVFNAHDESQASVVVEVGGHAVRSNHCYIQQAAGKPYIQCLDPRNVMLEPKTEAFILCALAKAKRIDESGLMPVVERPVIVTELHELEDLLHGAPSTLCVDIEMDSGRITCIGFAWFHTWQDFSGYHALTVPFERSGQSYWSPDDEAKVWQMIAALIDATPKLIFQNFIFDTMWLSRHGIAVSADSIISDTMILAHLLSPELPKGLRDLARLYLMCPPWKSLPTWESTEVLWEYNARDCMRTLQLHDTLSRELRSQPGAYALVHGQLDPLCLQVLRMCERGWTVDREALSALSRELDVQIAEIERRLKAAINPLFAPKVEYIRRTGRINRSAPHFIQVDMIWVPIDIPLDVKVGKKMRHPIFEQQITYFDFMPSSSDQVGEALIALGYHIPRLRGEETTNKEALKRLFAKSKDPLIGDILEHRKLSKMRSSYANVKLDPDGKLRFSINIAGGGDDQDDTGGTVLGRFSATKTPWDTGLNVQTIPSNFKHILIPALTDWVVVNMDFKQADPHMVAWLSGEQRMLAELARPGGDLHKLTASSFTGKPFDEIAPEGQDRKLGKEANNALNYGMGWRKFRDRVFFRTSIELSDSEAQRLHAKYFETYPAVRQWHQSVEQQLMQTRTLSTPFGRRRYFFGNYWDEGSRRKLIRDATAYIPPTTVADAVNAGWLKFVRLARERGLREHVLLQCHDSLTLECPMTQLDSVIGSLRDAYNSVEFEVSGQSRRFPIEVSWGPHWGQLVKWKGE